MSDDATVLALQAAYYAAQPAARHRFIDLERERNGWNFSYKQARARILQWLDPDEPHQFPAAALPNAMLAFGHADFMEPIHATEAVVLREKRIADERRAELERELERERASKLRKVEPVRRRGAA